jgi:hypothetical protein
MPDRKRDRPRTKSETEATNYKELGKELQREMLKRQLAQLGGSAQERDTKAEPEGDDAQPGESASPGAPPSRE